MVIREANGELDISGSPAELDAVAARIERLADGGGSLSVDADATADPGPYKRCLAALEVRATADGGPVRVAVSGDRVVVTGGSEMMRGFASFFGFNADDTRGAHHHHDWFEGNPYVAQGSAPLVVSVG
jgi:hypothetical protein